MDIQSEIETLSERMELNQTIINQLIDNTELFESCNFEIVPSGRSSRVIISNIDQLTEARNFMRELLGEWKDEIGTIFYCTGTAISTWNSLNKDDLWSIWLQCKLEDFPKELLPSDSCQWVETPPEKDYSLVCDI